jgi:hypothetical protein
MMKDVVVVFREAFSSDPSIHPSVLSSIHGWHHTRKKTLAEINKPPPFAHVSMSRKGMPGPRGGGTPKILISISITNPTYILHTMPENIQERMRAFIAQHGSGLATLAILHQQLEA